MRVRILGGGVAGLAGAVALRRRGIDDVVALERDTPAELRARPGHGMMLMPNGVTALRALGADGCLSRHRALSRAVFQDERGCVLRSEPMDGVYCVTRRGLVDALRAGLPGDGADGSRSVLCAALNPGLAPARSRVLEIVMSTRLPELVAHLGSTFLKTMFPDRGLAFGLLSPSTDHAIGFLQFDVQRHGVPPGAAGSGLVDFAAATAGLCSPRA